MAFRYDIQILRGFCVLLVVFFHLKIKPFDNGFLGVDVFFVISGYLMALLFDHGSIKDFYARRIKRLLPAYIATIFFVLVISSFFVVPVDFSQLVAQVYAAGFLSPNLLYWSQNSYFSKAEFNPLLNLWSIGVEAQFYLIVPFLLPFLKTRNWLTIIVFLTSLLSCVLVASISPKTAFFHVPFRIWEFLIGAFVAWNYKDEHKKDGRVITRYILLLVFTLMFFVPMNPESTALGFGHPGIMAVLVCFMTGLLLIFGIPNSFQHSVVGKVFITLGQYSYSIYLVHFPLIVLYNYDPFGGTVLGFNGLGSLVILATLIAIFSVLMFHFTETRNDLFFKNKTRTSTFIIGCCIVGALVSTQNTKSYSQDQRNIFYAWQDRSEYRCGKIFRVMNPTAHICSLTKRSPNNDRKVLLIGNSHADAIKASISNIAQTHDASVFFYVSNEPLINKGINYKSILKDIRYLSVDAVIIHFSNRYENAYFKEQVNNLLANLKRTNVKTYLIEPVPTYKLHIPKYMYNVSVGIDQNLTYQDLASHRLETKVFWDEVAPHASYLETAGIYCKPVCTYATKSKEPYYFDSGHLTLTGSKLLEPALKKMFSDIYKTTP